MKSLKINKVKLSVENQDFFKVKEQLKNLTWHSIAECNWKADFPYTPSCRFQIGHDDKQIVLHFDVEEENVKASSFSHNQEIWKDSCVEFFVSLDGKKTYFNFEFNPLGVGLIGKGTSNKAERTRLTNEEINEVNAFSTIQGKVGEKKWALILIIPIGLLGLEALSGKQIHANFYKCGDDLPKPHFLSWNPIQSDKPNFHLPEFFGNIEFE